MLPDYSEHIYIESNLYILVWAECIYLLSIVVHYRTRISPIVVCASEMPSLKIILLTSYTMKATLPNDDI